MALSSSTGLYWVIDTDHVTAHSAIEGLECPAPLMLLSYVPRRSFPDRC